MTGTSDFYNKQIMFMCYYIDHDAAVIETNSLILDINVGQEREKIQLVRVNNSL